MLNFPNFKNKFVAKDQKIARSNVTDESGKSIVERSTFIKSSGDHSTFCDNFNKYQISKEETKRQANLLKSYKLQVIIERIYNRQMEEEIKIINKGECLINRIENKTS